MREWLHLGLSNVCMLVCTRACQVCELIQEALELRNQYVFTRSNQPPCVPAQIQIYSTYGGRCNAGCQLAKPFSWAAHLNA